MTSRRRPERGAEPVADRETLGAGYFEQMYQASADPWGFTSRWYEKRKYAITIAMLPAERYHDAFEPGCSIGVFTALLAGRCDRLLSCDTTEAAVAAAAERTSSFPQARVERRAFPSQWPAGSFDLIVFSEFLYYFSNRDLDDVLARAASSLRPGGTLLAVHWRHPVPEHPQSGDAVHRRLAGLAGLSRLAAHSEADFLADVHIRTDQNPQSVAQATGLA